VIRGIPDGYLKVFMVCDDVNLEIPASIQEEAGVHPYPETYPKEFQAQLLKR
jgi:hypothetical protein